MLHILAHTNCVLSVILLFHIIDFNVGIITLCNGYLNELMQYYDDLMQYDVKTNISASTGKGKEKTPLILPWYIKAINLYHSLLTRFVSQFLIDL